MNSRNVSVINTANTITLVNKYNKTTFLPSCTRDHGLTVIINNFKQPAAVPVTVQADILH